MGVNIGWKVGTWQPVMIRAAVLSVANGICYNIYRSGKGVMVTLHV